MMTLLQIALAVIIVETILLFCVLNRLWISNEKLADALYRLANRPSTAPSKPVPSKSTDTKFLRAVQSNERKESRITSPPSWFEDSKSGGL